MYQTPATQKGLAWMLMFAHRNKWELWSRAHHRTENRSEVLCSFGCSGCNPPDQLSILQRKQTNKKARKLWTSTHSCLCKIKPVPMSTQSTSCSLSYVKKKGWFCLFLMERVVFQINCNYKKYFPAQSSPGVHSLLQSLPSLIVGKGKPSLPTVLRNF